MTELKYNLENSQRISELMRGANKDVDLSGRVKELMKTPNLEDPVASLQAKLSSTEAKLQEAIECLKHYAYLENYADYTEGWGVATIDETHGHKARDCLAQIKGK